MLVNGNALHLPLKDKSVQCCVTSPPYWGLRDYGVNRQLGLEQTPEEYVENMVKVFREAWRVLRDDGVLWLNLGDSYASGGRKTRGPGQSEIHPAYEDYQGIRAETPQGLKPKDLVGIPWRVAFALQADGWYLRNDIIWHKPNPMPESVTDRCTKSHEYIFLLTKNKKYYYDHEAIKEGVTGNTHSRGTKLDPPKGNEGRHKDWCKLTPDLVTSRNKRTVWTATTKPYKGAHYATFPPDLIDDCIKAGTSEKGKCPECGSPWERVIESKPNKERTRDKLGKGSAHGYLGQPQQQNRGGNDLGASVKTVGWDPGCKCGHDPVPCIVLDPFIGSGTTCMVARDLGCESVGLDLSIDYLVNNAKKRLEIDKLEYWTSGGQEVETNLEGLPMFSE